MTVRDDADVDEVDQLIRATIVSSGARGLVASVIACFPTGEELAARPHVYLGAIEAARVFRSAAYDKLIAHAVLNGPPQLAVAAMQSLMRPDGPSLDHYQHFLRARDLIGKWSGDAECSRFAAQLLVVLPHVRWSESLTSIVRALGSPSPVVVVGASSALIDWGLIADRYSPTAADARRAIATRAVLSRLSKADDRVRPSLIWCLGGVGNVESLSRISGLIGALFEHGTAADAAAGTRAFRALLRRFGADAVLSMDFALRNSRAIFYEFVAAASRIR